MFNRFGWMKPNIKKFTLLIEKVTFQEKQYKILFQQNLALIGDF